MDFARRLARSFAGLALLFLSALVVLLATAPASAATLSISKSGISRIAPLRSDPVTRYWVNRAECISGDVIRFPLIIGDYYGSELEVWATDGTGDCTSREARTTTNATCWRVFRQTPTTNVPTIDIAVQDVAARKKPPVFDTSVGTAADCQSTATAAQQVTLYFMLIRSLDNQGGESWATSLDLLGPNAPSGLTVGAGSTLLKAEWMTNNDTDVTAYRFFCDPPPGSDTTAPDSSFGPGPRVTDASGGTGSVCPDASAADGGKDDAAGSDASDDATCTPGTGTGGGSSTGVGACAATALAQGVVPDPDFVSRYGCGDSTGRTTTSAFIKGLTNWQPTSVAIAAVDAVGNAGPLSDVICGIPKPVNGFDEVYRQAGGNAGDGFCSIGHPGARNGTSFLGSALLALPLLLVRRRRGRRISAATWR
jgi:hypothetical protein